MHEGRTEETEAKDRQGKNFQWTQSWWSWGVEREWVLQRLEWPKRKESVERGSGRDVVGHRPLRKSGSTAFRDDGKRGRRREWRRNEKSRERRERRERSWYCTPLIIKQT